MTGNRMGTLVSRGFLYAAGTCFLFATTVTVGDVMVRALAARNIPGAIELTSLSVGLGAVLSMPVCYASRSHVTARLLSEVLPNRFNFPLDVLGSIASLIFAAVVVVVVGKNAWSKLGSPETTADLGVSIPVALCIVTAALVACLAATVAGLRFALRHEWSW